jgi:hypothetical protein
MSYIVPAFQSRELATAQPNRQLPQVQQNTQGEIRSTSQRDVTSNSAQQLRAWSSADHLAADLLVELDLTPKEVQGVTLGARKEITSGTCISPGSAMAGPDRAGRVHIPLPS